MENFVLFNNDKKIENKLSNYLEKMKESKLSELGYQTFNNYINICDWVIRRQEYNFTIDVLEEYASSKSDKLKVLDIGCGVVPLCNYFSNQGHEVVAIDPIQSDIEFINKNNLNSLYGTDINYLHQYGEVLPFDDNTFDVVYSVSVLEHIPTGNDKVVLNEAMRVLKKGGLLVLTTDVIPNNMKKIRDYTSAFTSITIKNIFDFFAEYSNLDNDKKSQLLKKLECLTWDDVYDFWIKTKNVDQRDDEKREYLAVGFHCIKDNNVSMPEDEKLKLFIEGESSLITAFYYYQGVATEREEQMIEKEEVIQTLLKKIDTLEQNTFIKILNKIGLIK